MQVLTRGGISPQNKHKVFFASHEMDHAEYIKSLGDDVLRFVNAALYYDDTFGKELDINDVLEMQLIIVPITYRLLEEPNYARDVVLKIALENNIPVLPIEVEKEASMLFDKVIGKLQCLSKISNDGSELPYGEKLEIYLNNIFPTEQENEDIKEVFDLNVFISYRKKDRKVLNEIVKLILATSGCERIGFWYDEYLKAGEKYDDAIDNAIKNSDVVLLIGTENIYDGNNYVVTDEYPSAFEKYKKPMISIEMDNIDVDKFYTTFPEIKIKMSYTRRSEWKDILNQIIDTYGNRKSRSLYNNYLIALAYHSGTNVEKDVDKAIAILEDNVNKGHIISIDKLMELYSVANGVSLNIERVFELAYIRIKCYEEILKEEFIEENLYNYCSSLYDYSAFCRESGNIGLAITSLESIINICSKIQDIENLSSYKLVLFAFSDLALLFDAQGEYEKANEYRKVWNKLSNLAMDQDSKEYRRSRFVSMVQEGDSALKTGEFAKAKMLYDEACEYSKGVYENNPNVSTRSDYSSVLERYGDYYLEIQEFEKSVEYYDAAVQLACENRYEDNNLHTMRTIYWRFYCAGKAALAGNDIMTARTYFNKASNAFIKITKAMEGSPIEEQLKYAPEIRRVYELLYNINLQIGKVEDAKGVLFMIKQLSDI